MNIISGDPEVPKSGLIPVNIGGISTEPITQGGMGVAISTAELAGTVARNGGIGTLSSVGLSLTPRYKHILREYLERAKINKRLKGGLSELSPQEKNEAFRAANLQCLRLEIRKAKEISEGKGQIWLNVMVAVDDYESHVRVACEEGIDGIVSGAGAPLDLPKYTAGYPNVSLIPIVSRAKGVGSIMKYWWKHYGRLPDGVVLEDPSSAGGHLGAIKGKLENVDHPETLLINSIPAAQEIIHNILAEIKNTDTTKRYIPPNIPIIAAGGIADRSDLDRVLALGADAGQLGSRFLASIQSNASERFKQAILKARVSDDIIVYRSSTGLPARALSISGAFVGAEDIEIKVRACVRNCLGEGNCAYRDGWGKDFAEGDKPLQRCIAGNLANATAGNAPGAAKRDTLFVGTTVLRIDNILDTTDIMDMLKTPVNK